jgi:hypothetical protein
MHLEWKRAPNAGVKDRGTAVWPVLLAVSEDRIADLAEVAELVQISEAPTRLRTASSYASLSANGGTAGRTGSARRQTPSGG